jgi:NADPH-dependent dioxygenase
MGKHETDVLVVGAGPVGLVAALLLVDKEIRVQIVEEHWAAAARSYGLAIHPRSLELFEEIGLLEDLLAKGRRVENVALCDGPNRQVELDLSVLSSSYPFVLVLPQQDLEEVLIQQLDKKGVPVLWNHRFAGVEQDQDGCRSRIERLSKESTGYAVARTEWVVDKEFETKSAFVLGADGHRSTVRRSLGLDYQEFGETLRFAVFEFETQQPSGKEMAVVLDDRSTNVLWPMSGGRSRWSFELEEEQFIEPRVKKRLSVQVHQPDFPYFSRDKLLQFVHERAPWFDSSVENVVWSATVDFPSRLVNRFGEGRCWLLGDSAHMVWPVGVQSMNVGFVEALEVSGRLEAILGGRAGTVLLEEYGDVAGQLWRRLLKSHEKARVHVESGDWIQKRAARVPSSLPASGKDLNCLLAELGISLKLE